LLMKNVKSANEEKAELLLECPLFKGLSGDSALQMASRAAIRKYDKGERLFVEGDDAKGFFLLLEGKIKVFKTSQQGREQILHIFEPPAPVGEVPTFEGGAYPAEAQALSATKVFYIERHGFLEIAKKNPDVLLSLLAILSRRLRNLVELLSDISFREVTARLAKYLLSSGRDQFELPVSKKLLSGELGTIPETLSRSLSALENEGLIKVDGKEIIISGRKQLERLSKL
jgi:CRP/FNR family transcriptional regulator, dissimilatory nitrate respiration regulator